MLNKTGKTELDMFATDQHESVANRANLPMTVHRPRLSLISQDTRAPSRSAL